VPVVAPAAVPETVPDVVVDDCSVVGVVDVLL
jgi:hypothetical protein